MNGSAFPQNDKKQLSRLVDSRYQSNDPNVSGDPVLNAPQPPVTEPVLGDVFLWKHVVRGIDESTKRITYVSVDAVYIIAKFPANDPLVMLQRMAENRTKLCTLLTNTMNLFIVFVSSVQSLVLGKPSCACSASLPVRSTNSSTLTALGQQTLSAKPAWWRASSATATRRRSAT